MTLTDFLLARIAEDEAQARNLMEEWESSPPSVYDVAQVGYLDAGVPERVLAECEAKRRIVSALGVAEDRLVATPAHRIDYLPIQERRDALEYAAEAIAVIYADHPDYREEWKP